MGNIPCVSRETYVDDVDVRSTYLNLTQHHPAFKKTQVGQQGPSVALSRGPRKTKDRIRGCSLSEDRGEGERTDGAREPRSSEDRH